MSHTIPKKTALAIQQPTKAFTTASAMSLLWTRASREMHLHELEWFADGAAEQVGSDIRRLADVLEETACLASSGKSGFQDSGSVSNLLFNLQSQLTTLAGLAEISADAGFMVRAAWKDGAK